MTTASRTRGRIERGGQTGFHTGFKVRRSKRERVRTLVLTHIAMLGEALV